MGKLFIIIILGSIDTVRFVHIPPVHYRICDHVRVFFWDPDGGEQGAQLILGNKIQVDLPGLVLNLHAVSPSAKVALQFAQVERGGFLRLNPLNRRRIYALQKAKDGRLNPGSGYIIGDRQIARVAGHGNIHAALARKAQGNDGERDKDPHKRYQYDALFIVARG